MPEEVYIASIVFFIMSVFGLMVVIQMLIKPMSFVRTATRTSGVNFYEFAGRDEESYFAVRYLFNIIGSWMLIANLLTLIVSLTAFREQQAWTWFAFWCWPASIIWQLFVYDRKSVMWYIQVFWLVLSAGSLIWTNGYFI